MDSAPQSRLARIPVEVIVSVGRARPTVAQLMALEQDSVVELDKSVNDPVELYVGDRLIARGELQELDGENLGQLAVRLTEVAEADQSL